MSMTKKKKNNVCLHKATAALPRRLSALPCFRFWWIKFASGLDLSWLSNMGYQFLQRAAELCLSLLLDNPSSISDWIWFLEHYSFLWFDCAALISQAKRPILMHYGIYAKPPCSMSMPHACCWSQAGRGAKSARKVPHIRPILCRS